MANKDLCSFKEIKDTGLRVHNQAVVMANLFEDNVQRGKETTSSKGAALVMNYFNNIPTIDQKEVLNKYREFMQNRGFTNL